MNRLKLMIALSIAAVILLAGCADANKIKESDIADKTYIYENEGFGGDFYISLKKDGTFSYYEGMLSSYIGTGNWTLDGNTLHLADTGIQTEIQNFYFQVDGTDLIYMAEDSDDFTHVNVSDGERFLCSLDAS